jgi:hypothetical protein
VESDTWTGNEDTIRAQDVLSSAGLALDISHGNVAPLGINTSNAIVLSPPFQVYSHAADDDHRAAAMASYGESRSRVVGNTGRNAVFDLSQDCDVFQIHCKGLIKDTPSLFVTFVNGCTCSGCIDLKYGVIYKMKFKNCVCNLKSNPKCLSIHPDTLSCQESCGASMCPKCHVRGLLVDVHQ